MDTLGEGDRAVDHGADRLKPSDLEGPCTSASVMANLPVALLPQDTEADAVKEFGLTELFQNELIAEKIVGFLNLSDMKELSEVSSGLSRSIRNSQRFSEKAMLLICKETVGLEYLLVDSVHPWKLVQIDLSLPIEVIDIISHILETVQTLQMRIVLSDNVDEKDLVKFIIFLLTNTPALTTLQIESTIMEKVLYDVFSDLGAQAQLSKIKCLEICGWRLNNQATHYIDGTDGDEGPFPRNFLQLSLIPMVLETFKMAKIGSISNSESEHVKFIPNIVSANQDTLIELSLHLNVWRLDDMKTIRCPKLKCLTITAYESHAAVVIAFLINQPLLEELSVDMREGFPFVVLSAIQGKCSKLKKLHLKGKAFTGISAPIDWRFLTEIQSLKDFRISRPLSILVQGVDQYGTGMKFLNLLPHGLNKLELRGLDKFWHDLDVPGWDMVILDVPQRILLLQPFENLTEFSLLRCEDAFTDDVFQHICKEFKNLRVLELSHCNSLTDFGLTGIRPELSGDDGENGQAGEDTGISLKNLKALRKFKIRACPFVTPNGLLQAVALPYLHSFDYLSVIAVGKEFVLSIAQQNPSLESFSVFVSELESVQQIKGDLKKVNRRLCQFCNLNEEEWVEQDSDSDADSYNNFLDGDSNISGGVYDGFDDDYDHYDDFDNHYEYQGGRDYGFELDDTDDSL